MATATGFARCCAALACRCRSATSSPSRGPRRGRARPRDGVYWAGRATLVRRPEDSPLYDRAFAVYWEGRQPSTELVEGDPEHVTLLVDDGPDEDEDDAGDAAADEPTMTLRFSATEVLRHKDFAVYSHDELHEAQRLMADLRLAGTPRHSRRLVATHHEQHRPDLRRTVRAALRAGASRSTGTGVNPASGSAGSCSCSTSRARWSPTPGVAALRARGGRRPAAGRGVRPRHPSHPRHPRARHPRSGSRPPPGWRARSPTGPAAPASARGCAASTISGESAAWPGAIVVVLSDGWDRGDPEVLAEQMARLHRVAHRVVWVNPLKVTPGYAPLARNGGRAPLC